MGSYFRAVLNTIIICQYILQWCEIDFWAKTLLKLIAKDDQGHEAVCARYDFHIDAYLFVFDTNDELILHHHTWKGQNGSGDTGMRIPGAPQAKS